MRDKALDLSLGYTIRAAEQWLLDQAQAGQLHGTVHTCIGQEIPALALGSILTPDDFVFSNHRGHGHFLASGGTVLDLLTQVTRGPGGSQHLHHARFISGGIQAGLAPIAAGMAMAKKIQGKGIVYLCIGDGTWGQGVLYETLRIAALWELPLVVWCEHNRYAQSTQASPQQTDRLPIPVLPASQWDVDDLGKVAKTAASLATTTGPVTVIVQTYRLVPHSKGMDNRPPKEVADYSRVDPLNTYPSDQRSIWEEQATRKIAAAVKAVNDSAYLPLPPRRPYPYERGTFQPYRSPGRGTQLSWIRAALRSALDSGAHLLGEDIEDMYGGAFKVTRGLSSRFPGQVHNTPISEAAITGLGLGLALAGVPAITEIMFGDFLALCADQWINQAGTLAGIIPRCIPFILRTPVGGYRGYGPTHSQCLESHFVGVPNTQVILLHHRCDPQTLYAQALQDGRPTLIIENKTGYSTHTDDPLPPGYKALIDPFPYPTWALRPDRRIDCAVIALGGMGRLVEDCLHAQPELNTLLLCPTRVFPLDDGALFSFLSIIDKLIVVEEGRGFASIGGEVLLRAYQYHPGLRGKLISASMESISANPHEETRQLPSRERIIAAIQEWAA